MFFNAFILALREIRRNITRAFLTVIGVVIGVAAVVTMVTLGRGATEMVKSQISNLGSNLMILRPGQGWGGRRRTGRRGASSPLRGHSERRLANLSSGGSHLHADLLFPADRGGVDNHVVGDRHPHLDHQEQFQRLVNEHERYANYKPEILPQPNYEIPQARPQPDAKAVTWANHNSWFEGQNELEKEMTGYAYAVSDVLIREQKMDPRSDKYYEEINKRVSRRFPEYFQKPEPEIDATVRVASVVAPAVRTSKASRTVRLTPSQVSLAKRFGLTPEQYVTQYLKDYGHG
jgi:hypothetical protein